MEYSSRVLKLLKLADSSVQERYSHRALVKVVGCQGQVVLERDQAEVGFIKKFYWSACRSVFSESFGYRFI